MTRMPIRKAFGKLVLVSVRSKNSLKRDFKGLNTTSIEVNPSEKKNGRHKFQPPRKQTLKASETHKQEPP